MIFTYNIEDPRIVDEDDALSSTSFAPIVDMTSTLPFCPSLLGGPFLTAPRGLSSPFAGIFSTAALGMQKRGGPR